MIEIDIMHIFFSLNADEPYKVVEVGLGLGGKSTLFIWCGGKLLSNNISLAECWCLVFLRLESLLQYITVTS